MKREDVKYRIVEYGGVFSIQVYGYKHRGILWWRRKVWSWYWATKNGAPYVDDFIIDMTRCDSFNSKIEAEYRILLWRTRPVYHEVIYHKA